MSVTTLSPAKPVIPLVGAITTGYLLFGDLPDAYTWTGAALIVGSGLFIGWRETRERPTP